VGLFSFSSYNSVALLGTDPEVGSLDLASGSGADAELLSGEGDTSNKLNPPL
jgi:hypothetical protein